MPGIMAMLSRTRSPRAICSRIFPRLAPVGSRYVPGFNFEPTNNARALI